MTSLFSKHAGELCALTLRLDDPVTERVHDRAGGCLVAAGLSGAAAERLAQHQLRHEPAACGSEAYQGDGHTAAWLRD